MLAVWRTRTADRRVVVALCFRSSFCFRFAIGRGHLLRAYLLGYVMTFSFAGGALALLMLQYVSGGKWGLLLRRPLEAMARTLPIVFALLFIPLAIFLRSSSTPGRSLPDNASDARRRAQAAAHRRSRPTHHQCQARHVERRVLVAHHCRVRHPRHRHPVLPEKWSVERDADPTAGSQRSFDSWQKRFENLSGPGILIYVIADDDPRDRVRDVAGRDLVLLDLGTAVPRRTRLSRAGN